MEEERKIRYRVKITYISNTLNRLPKPDSEWNKQAIFYAIHTSIEAILDVISMIVKDMGIGVKDNRYNIQKVVEERKLDRAMGEKLSKANGLRNIIVHRYNTFDELIILESIEEVKELIFQWIQVIEEILDELQ